MPVESAESLGDEVEESSAGVSPVLPNGGSVRSVENCGIEFISNGPQLVGHSPDIQLLCCLLPGGSVLWRPPGWALVLGQQVRQRSLPAVGPLILPSVRI